MTKEQIIPIAIGFLLVLIGCSFAYKFVRACVMGKLDYWAGFLPLSIISPFFVHTTAPDPERHMLKKRSTDNKESKEKPKRSLVKQTSGLWVHTIIGPLFLVMSILFITAGFDLMGMPGTDTLNFILNGGNKSAPLAVTYDKKYTFRFPFLMRALKRFGRKMNSAQIPLPDNQRTIDSAEIRAEETRRQREADRND